MKGYFNKEICTQCGGACCKNLPGENSPEDIGTLFPSSSLTESVHLALQSGKYAIDWWEGDPSLPYVRPRTKNAQHKMYDPSWGGECIFLSGIGCELTDDARPYVCRMVKPREGGSCRAVGMKRPKYIMGRKWAKTGVDLWQWR